MPELIRFIPQPRKTPGGNERTQDNAAAKAQESAKNSHIMAGGLADGAGTGRRSPTPTQRRSNLSTRILRFPLNVQTGRTDPSHYIIFNRIKLEAGRGSEGDKSITLKNKKKSTKAQISLYMPASVNVGYKSKYQDLEVGIGAELGASVADAIKNVTTVGTDSAAATKEASRIKNDLIAAGGDVANQIALGAINSALGILPGMGGFKEVAQLKANKVLTDKMELFFKGVNRREFQYEFTFIPTSAEESRAVNNIIQEFKSAMLPEYSGFNLEGVPVIGGTQAAALTSSAISDRTLTVPDLFDIKYMYLDENYSPKRNRYLNRITSCYLTDMSVKYGSDRYTAYRPDDIGAPPQNTSVTLNFQEVEIVTRERAEKGF